ncbi:TetR/AcrR family transcriptional regulator [Ancylobacter lacus]|uniref:TetR/AcrR family transcriptional regulator n=1 Tax=Ancylobacter lacus TaxID=2579970 RepID=UPI001BCC80D3|nr:TetR/AcrR family transcriptional regulator [Ancylobacter lacus]MBS7538449.1 TetR/AcrR family transcriptional regulator [Ancylobacter lacus]
MTGVSDPASPAVPAEGPAATGWRGSPELWLEAAYASLVEGGVGAVRIQTLAARLKLARTSFYWFFRDREELLAALVDRWRAKNTGNLVARTQAYAETIVEATLNVFDCWLDEALFDSQFEFAIRSWALQSAEIAEEVTRADEARLAALTALYVRFGYDPLTADVRARAAYLVQIGYISMKSREDLATRMRRIPDYVTIFTGRSPEPRELDRFFARHGFVPGPGAG